MFPLDAVLALADGLTPLGHGAALALNAVVETLWTSALIANTPLGSQRATSKVPGQATGGTLGGAEELRCPPMDDSRSTG
jgi:hypothetical protein